MARPFPAGGLIAVILDLMKTRSSVRRFSERDITDADLRVILESARLSPSGGNGQPYNFIVIRDRERIAEIARIVYNQE
jgi:nitroreductase